MYLIKSFATMQLILVLVFEIQKSLMGPFSGWDSTVSRLQGHYETVFNNMSPGIPGTHLISLRRIKNWAKLEPPSGLEPGMPGLGIQHLNHKVIAEIAMECYLFWTMAHDYNDMFTNKKRQHLDHSWIFT